MYNSVNIEDSYTRIELKMSFTMEDTKNPSLKELGDFLMAISKIHEFAILNSQSEYNSKYTKDQNRLRIFPFHELETITFCRKNPFDMEICFHISKEGLSSYLIYLKALLFICKRYGKNSNQISIPVNILRLFMEQIGESLKSNSFISKQIKHLSNVKEMEAYLVSLNSKLDKIRSNQIFRKHFNQICKTSIIITRLVSYVSETSESFGFLQD